MGEVFGEELMDKTKPDFYMVNFLRDDVLDEEGSLVEEAPKARANHQKKQWNYKIEYSCLSISVLNEDETRT